MSAESANGSFYNRILSEKGMTALLAFMVVSFLMYTVYQGQQEQKKVLEQINSAAARAAVEDVKQTEILEDIRFALREQDGLTMRPAAR